MRILTGSANRPLAEQVSERLGVTLCPADAKDLVPGRFPDGEVRIQVQHTVRGKDVFVIQPTSPPVNDHLMELLLMIDAL
ncbi:TPA: ribose-phosphate pyrophosphokinase, partial [Candidatus Bipolaricaulota bacterium]|nr:ribose-phosphate pyrophosphokinase [Candidatus Bipolaricaulota bacterium]